MMHGHTNIKFSLTSRPLRSNREEYETKPNMT